MNAAIKRIVGIGTFLLLPMATASTSLAEIRPNDECKNCTLINGPFNGSADAEWQLISRVCEVTTSYADVFPGVPVTKTGGSYDCINCPTVNGQPCEPGTGPSLDCNVNITSTITVEASIDFSASGGVDLGIFNKEFEVSVGFTTSHAVAVGVQGTYSTPYCQKAHLVGKFTHNVGKVGKVTASFKRTDTYQWKQYVYDEIFSCAGGSATMTFDSSDFVASFEVQSLNSCDYDGDGDGDGGNGGGDE